LSHNVWAGSRNGGDVDHDMDLTIQPLGNDVLLIFRLMSPEKQSWMVGDIIFSTRQDFDINERCKTSSTPGDKTKTDATGDAEYVPFPDLQAQLDRLPQSSLIELRQQLQNLAPRNKSYRIKPIVVNQQAKIDRSAYKSPTFVPSVTDPTARLNRLRRIELIKTYLASHKIK